MARGALPDPLMDRVLIDESAIRSRIVELGRRITEDYAGKDPVFVTVLRGGLFFLADLCRYVELPLTMDFMAISSYGPGSHGTVRITKDLDDDIEGRHVVMVEDIIDTGLTLHYLLRMLRQRGPASLAVCTLLDKDVRRIVDLPVEYVGFRIPDRFVVGFGLDLRGRWRNLPYIATLKDEVWSG